MAFFNENLYRQVRIVALTYSKIGSSNATGALTKKLFSSFSPDNILNIYEGNNDSELKYNFKYTEFNKFECLEKIKYFNPNVIYLYMYGKGINIINLAKEIWEKYEIPLIVHVMDDFFEDLAKDCPLYQVSAFCITRAKYCLAISDKMVSAYQKRFGVPFFRISNFVNFLPTVFKRDSVKSGTAFSIKYFGNIDEKMSLAAVLEISQVIENMDDKSIKFDIYTYNHYIKLYSGLFNGKKTKLHKFVQNYPECLQQADLLIIAYNFDEETKKYLHLSCAQKLPEYLASGCPILAYGPGDIATIEQLQKYECTKLVSIQDSNELKQAICDLYENEALRLDLGAKARKVVGQYFTSENFLKPFEEKILHAAIKYKYGINWKNPALFEKNDVKISVVMVVKDNRAAASKTLNSIVNQKYKNFELVIIDGASTDGTKDVIESYKQIIDVFISEPDDGIYDAMNKGICHSSGEYILFMNADAIFYDDFSLYALANAAEYSQCDVIIGQCEEYEDKKFFRYRKTYIDNSMFLKGCPFTPQAMLYRRKLHEKFGLYDTNYKIVSDIQFIYTLYINKVRFFEIDSLTVKFNRTGISVLNQDLRLQETQEVREKFITGLAPDDISRFLRFWEISMEDMEYLIKRYNDNDIFVTAASSLMVSRVNSQQIPPMNCEKVFYIPHDLFQPFLTQGKKLKMPTIDRRTVKRYKRQTLLYSILTLVMFIVSSGLALLFPLLATYFLILDMVVIASGTGLCLRSVLKRKFYQLNERKM